MFSLCMLLYTDAVFAAECTAAKCYVTQAGGTSPRDGTTWTKALSAADLVSGFNQETASSKLTRGSTYYIANGSYGSIVFDDPVSGSSWIRVLKATLSNSRTVAGWNDSFAGQAQFGTVMFATDYVEFNGQVRDELKWNDGSKYGFKVNSYIHVHWDNYRQDSGTVPRTLGGSFITIKYVNIGYPEGSAFEDSRGKGIGITTGGGIKMHDYVITHNFIHNTREPIHCANGCHHMLIDRNYIGPSWGKETIMALYGGADWTVSNNILVDNCQDLENDDTANGCSTEISGWANQTTYNFDNWQVFGNVITRKNARNTDHSDGAIFGGSASPVTGWRVYNNVIAGIGPPSGLQNVTIRITGEGNKVYNNLWYDIGANANVGCNITGKDAAADANTTIDPNECSNSWCYTGSSTECLNLGPDSIVGDASPFPNFAGGDFTLAANSSAKDKGKNLSGISGFAPGVTDFLNKVRGADGYWDIGALEFSAGGGNNAAPSAPSNLTVQ